uniref:Uncharacterized protein n=1 Tax=Anopheles atroparvus TaxID=41427 RepID=A0AAG5DHH7_ANOAO
MCKYAIRNKERTSCTPSSKIKYLVRID